MGAMEETMVAMEETVEAMKETVGLAMVVVDLVDKVDMGEARVAPETEEWEVQWVVAGQGRGRGDGKQGVVDAESRQSPNSHGDSPTTLRVADSIRPPIIAISALTGLTGVGVVPHPPADREDQWRR